MPIRLPGLSSLLVVGRDSGAWRHGDVDQAARTVSYRISCRGWSAVPPTDRRRRESRAALRRGVTPLHTAGAPALETCAARDEIARSDTGSWRRADGAPPHVGRGTAQTPVGVWRAARTAGRAPPTDDSRQTDRIRARPHAFHATST